MFSYRYNFGDLMMRVVTTLESKNASSSVSRCVKMATAAAEISISRTRRRAAGVDRVSPGRPRADARRLEERTWTR